MFAFDISFRWGKRIPSRTGFTSPNTENYDASSPHASHPSQPTVESNHLHVIDLFGQQIYGKAGSNDSIKVISGGLN